MARVTDGAKKSETTDPAAAEKNTSSGLDLLSKLQSQLWKTFCYPCNTQFFFIKTFYFAFYGGLGCILPFLSLFFKQSGLTPLQMSWIWGIKPAMTLLGAPLWGAIGDGYHISRLLLIGSLLVWMGVYAGMVFLPTPVRQYSCSAIEDYPQDSNNSYINSVTQSSLLTRKNVFITADQYIQTTSISAINQNVNKSLRISENSIASKHRMDEEAIVNAEESLYWLYKPEDTTKLFIMIMVLINVGEFFTSPATALADASTTKTLGAKNMEYFGTQRAWGPVGFAVSSALVGYFISRTRYGDSYCGVTVFFSSYVPMAYALIVCMLLAMLCATQMKFQKSKPKDPEKSLIIDSYEADDEDINQNYSTLYVFRKFCNLYYGSWLLTAVFAGMCNGIVSGFLYWHMDNLGADQLLIGMASVTVSITEFLACFLVRSLAKLLGHKGVIYLSLFLYAVRFVIYGSVSHPTYILIAEVFRGLAYSSIWVSMVTYTSDILPESCYATLQGIILGLHLGLGSGTGQLIGGVLVHYYGASITFHIFGAASALYLLFFYLAQKFSNIPIAQYEMFESSSQVE